MRNWAKKTLLLVALLLVGVAALSGVGVALFKGTPDGYGADADAPSDEERARLARDAENKLIEAQNWVATLRADEQRAARAPASTAPAAPRAGKTYRVELSQHELNALFHKWSALYGWRDKYAELLDQPQVLLRDGKLILAGQMKELGAIASFQFRPSLDAQGGLRLELVKVAAGRLPLPEGVWAKWRDGMVASLQRRMPQWRATATIDPTGAANFPAMAATLSRLLFKVAENKPAEPVLFFPLADGGSSVPVRVAEVEVADGSLRMLVQPMTPTERSALLQRIRSATSSPPPREAQASGQ